jgi:predicted HAD superfamily Cof-like phosphohydrolase
MKTSSIEKVKEFHLAFGHPVHDQPHIGNAKLNALRVSLIDEENRELAEALARGDAVEALDALCDLQYVLDGAFLALGFHRAKDAAFAEVHSSNMSKLGADGKPVVREDGKILKGPNYRRPQLQPFIAASASPAAGQQQVNARI